MAMCFFYTYSWAQGIYNHWIKTGSIKEINSSMTFQKKPHIVEAVLFTGITTPSLHELINEFGEHDIIPQPESNSILVMGEKGPHIAWPGYYVMRDKKGRMSTMRKKEFDKEYEPIN